MRPWRRRFTGLGGAYRVRRSNADRQLVEILLATDGLHQLGVRQELLLITGGHMGLDHAMPVPESSEPRTHVRAIVRAARRTGKLRELRDALLELRPDDIGAAWFNLAATALIRPDGPVPGDLMLRLVEELRAHAYDFGQAAAIRYVGARRTAGRPLDCGPALPQVLFRLYDAREPVSASVPDPRRADLLGFLRLLDAEPGRSDRLGALIAAAPRGGHDDHCPPGDGLRSTGERQVVIQIRVEEEDAPSDLPYTQRRYSLRGFHYEGVTGDKPAFHCSWPSPGPFTGDELQAHGHAFLAAWRAQEQADWDVNRRVEFLLPDSLLGHPVELWPSGSSGRPLSRRCQVVVRSLRRYKDDFLHEEWRRRWAALDRDCPPGDALERIGWMSPDATGTQACGDGDCPDVTWDCPDSKYQPLRLTDPSDVEDWLRLHTDLACLGLGSPYDPEDPLIRDAVLDALLEDGIPVMVWRRDAGDPAALLDELRDGRPPTQLAELPDSVLEVRKRKRHDPASVGKQITLLWDDPTCVFSRQDSPMSGTRGAGEGAA
ncbi:VMAP-C domain-containing protein [Streptomyces sp. NPDC001920]